jgi:hypothetical protein
MTVSREIKREIAVRQRRDVGVGGLVRLGGID